jgi:hypothetical protein
MGGGHRGMMWHHMGKAGMGRGHMMGGKGRGHMMGQGMGPMPAADAKVEDIDGGVRIVLTPKDASQLSALRERTRLHGERMGGGECWMFQDQESQSGAE